MRLFHQKKIWLLFIVPLLAAAGALFWFTHAPMPWERSTDVGNQQTGNTNNWLEIREQQANRTVWAKETVAEDCGRVFESLWDSVNATTNKLGVISSFPFEEILLPDWNAVQHLPHDIELRKGSRPGQAMRANQWRGFVQHFANEGWQLENLEFRHNRFDCDTNNAPQQSQFYFSAHLTNSLRPERAMIEGNLLVNWTQSKPGDVPTVQGVDATQLELKNRVGEPFFKKILEETFIPSGRSPFIDPLIVYDLDGDGFSEILLPSKNLVYRRQSQDVYKAEPLCRYPLEFITTAVVADFDGDGSADMLCATSRGLHLFKGSPQGTFDDPPRLVWQANPPLRNALVLTCGDIDQDGDLDVFVGQYRVPTLGQVLRPYYYDANDGWPAYLLLNDGHGNFTDATDVAGLGKKRWRRTYSASFADLDGDGHLDLVVVSDFAGMDLYRNDGHGHFTDVTHESVAESHAFGMAHALSDFNADGRLDLLMIGMPSPTVDRLQHLDLWRPYSADDKKRRPAMTFGNRLYLAQGNGKFEQTAMSDSIARSGWSWGCSAFDFDNDGFPDVYIANGLESKESVRDYESEFWLHNLFVDESVDDVTSSRYLIKESNRTRGAGWSYGGYEKNRLFMNQKGLSFVDIGHLAGVSLEQDSRNVVADDLDSDGRVDLILTTQQVWPVAKQTLQIFRNTLGDAGHWIGFRFREADAGRSPVGVRVTLSCGDHRSVREIVTGDSHRSEHSAVLHFGLGASDTVDSAEVTWINGQTLTLKRPSVDQYHQVQAPFERRP